MTRDEVYTAIRDADKAGDADSVRKLSDYLRQMPEEGIEGAVSDTGEGYSPEIQAQIDAEKDDSALTGFLGGVVKPLDNLVTLARQVPWVAQADDFLADKLGMQNGAEAVAANDQMRANNTRDGYELAGNIVGTLPTLALPGGALVQGGAAGGLLTDETTATGIAKDVALSAVLSKGGEAAFQGAARALRGSAANAAPRVSPELQTLIDAGVEVTPGQIARSQGGGVGNFLARTEDRAVSTPFVGDRIVAGRNRSLETFGRATINRALEPIGSEVPGNLSGRRAVAFAGDRLSDAYEAILPRLNATGDQQFVSDLAAIHAEAASMLPARAEQFNRILTGFDRFWQNGSSLDGRALKAIETRIGKRVRDAAASTDADQRELGDRLGDVLAAVRDLAARQNPAEADALSRINQGWKSLTQVERAAGNSRGDITPAGYSQAVKMSSDTVRRRGYARGEALNQDLSDAASDILPSEIADTGSAGRWQQSNIIANLIGLAQTPVYMGLEASSPLLTRAPGTVRNGLSQLLEYGARAMPIAAPTTIHTISK